MRGRFKADFSPERSPFSRHYVLLTSHHDLDPKTRDILAAARLNFPSMIEFAAQNIPIFEKHSGGQMKNALFLIIFFTISFTSKAEGVWRLSSINYHVDPFTRCTFDEKSGDEGKVVINMASKCMGTPFPTFKIEAKWSAPPKSLIPGQVIPWDMTLTPLGCSGNYGGMSHLSATILDYDYMGPLNAGCSSAQGATISFVNKDQARPLKAPPPDRAWSKSFTLQVKVGAASEWMWDYVYTFLPEVSAGSNTAPAVTPAGSRRAPDVVSVGNITGTWNSSEGMLQLRQTGNSVSGSYPASGGRISGTISNGTLSGYWIQTRAQRQCSSSVEGSSYWGTIQWVFSGNDFVGKWGYCNDAPNQNWAGSR